MTTQDTIEQTEETVEAPASPEPVEEPTEAPPVKVEDTPEFQLALEQKAIRLAQSMKDKETTPLRQEMDRTTEENKRLREVLGVRETAELEEWGDEPKTRTLHDAERALRASRAAFEADRKQYNAGLSDNQTSMDETNAWRLAIDTVLSANPEFEAKFEALQKEFLECKDSDKAIGLLKQMRAVDFKVGEPANGPPAPRPAPTKPPSSTPGGTAGGKLTLEKIQKMSPAEQFDRSKEIAEFFATR